MYYVRSFLLSSVVAVGKQFLGLKNSYDVRESSLLDLLVILAQDEKGNDFQNLRSFLQDEVLASFNDVRESLVTETKSCGDTHCSEVLDELARVDDLLAQTQEEVHALSAWEVSRKDAVTGAKQAVKQLIKEVKQEAKDAAIEKKLHAQEEKKKSLQAKKERAAEKQEKVVDTKARNVGVPNPSTKNTDNKNIHSDKKVVVSPQQERHPSAALLEAHNNSTANVTMHGGGNSTPEEIKKDVEVNLIKMSPFSAAIVTDEAKPAAQKSSVSANHTSEASTNVTTVAASTKVLAQPTTSATPGKKDSVTTTGQAAKEVKKPINSTGVQTTETTTSTINVIREAVKKKADAVTKEKKDTTSPSSTSNNSTASSTSAAAKKTSHLQISSKGGAAKSSESSSKMSDPDELLDGIPEIFDPSKSSSNSDSTGNTKKLTTSVLEDPFGDELSVNAQEPKGQVKVLVQENKPVSGAHKLEDPFADDDSSSSSSSITNALSTVPKKKEQPKKRVPAQKLKDPFEDDNDDFIPTDLSTAPKAALVSTSSSNKVAVSKRKLEDPFEDGDEKAAMSASIDKALGRQQNTNSKPKVSQVQLKDPFDDASDASGVAAAMTLPTAGKSQKQKMASFLNTIPDNNALSPSKKNMSLAQTKSQTHTEKAPATDNNSDEGLLEIMNGDDSTTSTSSDNQQKGTDEGNMDDMLGLSFLQTLAETHIKKSGTTLMQTLSAEKRELVQKYLLKFSQGSNRQVSGLKKLAERPELVGKVLTQVRDCSKQSNTVEQETLGRVEDMLVRLRDMDQNVRAAIEQNQKHVKSMLESTGKAVPVLVPVLSAIANGPLDAMVSHNVETLESLLSDRIDRLHKTAEENRKKKCVSSEEMNLLQTVNRLISA